MTRHISFLMDISITIAIPTYNRATWLRRTLESLRRMTLPPDVPLEILVVDNACTDDTPRVLQETASEHYPCPFRWVRELQQGLCHARNRALAAANGNWVVFFDDDVLVSSEWVTAFVSAARQYAPDCVTGPVLPLFEEPPPSSLSQLVLDSVTSSYSLKGENSRFLLPTEAHQLPGCNFAVQKTTALQVGGFDPQLDRIGSGMLGYGDWEFGRALVRASKTVFYESRCRVEHAVGPNKLSRSALRARWRGFGVAARLLSERRGRQYSIVNLCKTGLRAAIGWTISRAAYLAGRDRMALEWELKAYREWGFVRGRPRM